MIRTSLTIGLDPVNASHTSYIINGAHLGYLAPGNQKNHVQTSNRSLQLIAAFDANPADPGAAVHQRERLMQWQLFSREIGQHGSQKLNSLMVHYRMFPDLLICLDEQWLRVWLKNDVGLFLVRNQILQVLDPLESLHPDMPDDWTARMAYYALKIEPDDYYLFLNPDTFAAFSPHEAVSILTGLRQLPAKMTELNQTIRDRRHRPNDNWLAIQVMRLEPDADASTTLADQVGHFWQSWRHAMNRNEHEAAEEKQCRGQVIDRAPGLESADDLTLAANEQYRLTDESAEQATSRRHRWLGILVAGVAIVIILLLIGKFLIPGNGGTPPTQTTTTLTTTATMPTTTTTVSATPTPVLTPTPATTTTAGKKMKVRTAQLNIRQKPNVNAKLVTTLRKGDTVTVLGKPDSYGWVKVKLADGRTGYANSSYLQ